ncbi:MAG: cache domain-containing protein [Burkholderiaceae bacterium]
MKFARTLSLKDYLRFRRRLLSAASAVIGLLLLLLYWTIYSSIQKDREAARVQIQTFVRAIEMHVAHTIESVDLSLISFSNAVKAFAPHEIVNDPLIERLLRRSRDVDSYFWLVFIDAQGKGVAASNEMDVQGRSYAHEDFYQAHVKSNVGLFVSAPRIDEYTKRPLFVISRRVENATGQFLGVIAAPFNARSFASMFSNARYDDDISITLTHRNGKIIARSPKFDESFGADVSRANHVVQANTTPVGMSEVISQLDGTPRIYSYRVIEQYPLIVSVGMFNPMITDSAMQILITGGIGTLMIILVIIASAHFTLISYANLEKAVKQRTSELSKSNELLRKSKNALRDLAAYQNRIKEEERKRIAREVHDELGGCLTGIKAYIAVAVSDTLNEGRHPHKVLSDAAQLADTAVDTVRRIISDLRPSVLDQLGIWAALEWYADQFAQRTGIGCICLLDEVEDITLNGEVSTMIFRIVQESLTNVARYAQAGHVVIGGRRVADSLLIEIKDDGVGITADQLLDQQSWGIIGMHERATHFGADLKISGKPGYGTVVALQLSLADELASHQ